METYRRRGDYASGGIERDTEELVKQTAAFLDAMQEVIDRDGHIV